MNEEKYTRIALEEVASTNDYAKEKRREGENLIVTAKRQTGGRGTKGRSFSSNEGGAFISRLTFYRDKQAKTAFSIMVGAAVAVCKTVEFYGLQPVVKWPNDVLVNGKKICGILIENTLSGERIASSVVGIGLNVNNPLPAELTGIATTLRGEGVRVDVEEVVDRLLFALEKEYTVEEYRKYLGFIGMEITLLFGDERIPATLLSVTNEGKLAVKIAGEYREISAAEVSLRI